MVLTRCRWRNFGLDVSDGSWRQTGLYRTLSRRGESILIYIQSKNNLKVKAEAVVRMKQYIRPKGFLRYATKALKVIIPKVETGRDKINDTLDQVPSGRTSIQHFLALTTTFETFIFSLPGFLNLN